MLTTFIKSIYLSLEIDVLVDSESKFLKSDGLIRNILIKFFT